MDKTRQNGTAGIIPISGVLRLFFNRVDRLSCLYSGTYKSNYILIIRNLHISMAGKLHVIQEKVTSISKKTLEKEVDFQTEVAYMTTEKPP